MLNIISIPAIKNDVFSFLIYNENRQAIAIDCGSFSAVDSVLKKQQLQLTDIYITHYHADHIAGTLELSKLYNAHIHGLGLDKARLPKCKYYFEPNECLRVFDDSVLQALYTPGHTEHDINFFLSNESILFTSDTLSTLGLHKCFGSIEKYLDSINLIKTLPADTRIYPSHNLSALNVSFIKNFLPSLITNDFNNYYHKVKNNNFSKLEDELIYNPFFRCNNLEIQNLLNTINEIDAFKTLYNAYDKLIAYYTDIIVFYFKKA